MVEIIIIVFISVLWYLNSVFSELALVALLEKSEKEKESKMLIFKSAIPIYNIWLVHKFG